MVVHDARTDHRFLAGELGQAARIAIARGAKLDQADDADTALVHHVAQHQIDAGIIAQPRERRVGIVGLFELAPRAIAMRAAWPNSPAREPMIRTRIVD